MIYKHRPRLIAAENKTWPFGGCLSTNERTNCLSEWQAIQFAMILITINCNIFHSILSSCILSTTIRKLLATKERMSKFACLLHIQCSRFRLFPSFLAFIIRAKIEEFLDIFIFKLHFYKGNNLKLMFCRFYF